MADTLLEQIRDDLDGVYDPVFGPAESVTGPSGAFMAIFSNEYYQAGEGGDVILSSSQPVMRSQDADALEHGDSVTRTSTSVAYVVVEVKPDGFGETIHRLQVA